MGRGWEYIVVDLNLTYAVAKFELEKLDMVKFFVIVWIVNILGLPIGKGRVEEGGLSIFLIDLNPIYVLVKLELGTYANWLVIVNFKCISIYCPSYTSDA